MRIAHFGKYAFIRLGGVERHVVDLTTALARHGLDVTAFVYDPSGRAEPYVDHGVRIEPVPTWITLSSQSISPALITRSRRRALDRRFDVIHQHWPDPFAHLAASLVPGNPAHVVTWHMDIVRQRIIRPMYHALGPRLLAPPNAIVASTQAHFTSNQVDRFAPPDRRHVIPFGINARPFEPSEQLSRTAREIRARFGGGPLVFALGRHVYYKGFDVLIRAMEQVPATLLLGGEGPLTDTLKRLARERSVRIEFLGSIPDRDLPAYFHACDVFCFPSVARTEAFGLSQAEAMACGKPVVNTELGNGVNELAPHDVCALTVPPSDEHRLADALTRIIMQPSLAARLGSAGRDRILKLYSVEVMIKRLVDLYESLLRVCVRR